MSDDLVREALHLMSLSRAIDSLVIKLQRLNRGGVYGPVLGQEAAVIGSALAVDPSIDWMVPASREQPAWLRHGLPLDNLLATYMGRLEQSRIPESVNLLPRQQSIGAQLPHAVGLAWALKLRGQPGVVLVYFGDGAASEGDFHESCNLAGLQRVPLVFLCVNNQWAISTPASKQTAGDVYLRAAGYGFPGVAVDGNDLFAVYAATSEAVGRARAGDGPTLIEARTYRLGFHNTSDNPREYRSDEEVASAAALDPFERLCRHAFATGIWSEAQRDTVLQAAAAEVHDSYARVVALPRPGPEAIYHHVYEQLPARIRRTRDRLLATPLLAADSAEIDTRKRTRVDRCGRRRDTKALQRPR